MVFGFLAFSPQKSRMKCSASSGMSSGPLAQRRHLDGDHGEAVEEVLAKTALAGQVGEVSVRRGDHAHVDAEGVLAPHALEGLLLQHAQHLGLGHQAHVADLVEEERAPVGALEASAAPADGAGEGAALVAEQLRLDQLLGDGRAVHLDEGPRAPRRLGVDGPRHQLLARCRSRRGSARGHWLARRWRSAGAASSMTRLFADDLLARGRAARAGRGSRARAGRGRARAWRRAAIFSRESGFSMKS